MVLLAHISAQMPPADEVLNFHLQMVAFRSCVAYIFVILAILAGVSFRPVFFHWWGSFEKDLVFVRNENMLSRMGEVSIKGVGAL